MTLVLFKCLWMIDWYPWFVALAPAYHNVMVAYPNFHYNNHIYGVSMALFILG